MNGASFERLYKSPRFFWFLLFFSLISLVLYRMTMQFPVWIDEVFMKAVVFGMPFWLYALVSKKSLHFFGMEKRNFWPGALNGLAIGGILSFCAFAFFALKKDHVLIPGLFGSTEFWKEFGLAFVTAIWESLFFYGLLLPVFAERTKSEINALSYTVLFFALFHLPNLVLRVGLAGSVLPLLLLTLFALGQGVVFLRTRSIATVIVSHAFWGMALLVYGR